MELFFTNVNTHDKLKVKIYYLNNFNFILKVYFYSKIIRYYVIIRILQRIKNVFLCQILLKAFLI